MGRADFIVRHDYDKETNNDLAKKIIVALFAKPLQYNKPVKVGMFGDSGEGKSTSYLTILTVILESVGVDVKNVLNETNAYTPLQYMEKLKALLYKKELKKIKVFGIHEARALISSKDWQNFINKAVGTVNAMSRSIKPLSFFIISQFLGDITKEVRKTLNYIIECERPIGQSTRVTIYKVWHDKRDIENIKIKKKKVRGIIVTPNGKRIPFMPSYIEFRLPDPEVLKQFDEQDTMSKKDLVENIIEKAIAQLKAKFDLENSRIAGAVDFYSENPDMLSKIGKLSRGKFKLNDNVKRMHDFSESEIKTFNEMLNAKLKSKKLTREEEEEVE